MTSLADSPPESLTAFVQGLYMQSPMYKMCRKGASGLNVLRDIAPDDFFETDIGEEDQCCRRQDA